MKISNIASSSLRDRKKEHPKRQAWLSKRRQKRFKCHGTIWDASLTSGVNDFAVLARPSCGASKIIYASLTSGVNDFAGTTAGPCQDSSVKGCEAICQKSKKSKVWDCPRSLPLGDPTVGIEPACESQPSGLKKTQHASARKSWDVVGCCGCMYSCLENEHHDLWHFWSLILLLTVCMTQLRCAH